MIVIDGSKGEGGGQVLRSALALSMVTGRPFRIHDIRANRSRPGLLRQHLTAVKAAETISGARVTGAAMGARELTFEPGPVVPGDYTFAVGTAGSTTLVLQAILPALMLANGPARLTLEGGTHAASAPPFEFLELSLLPLFRRMGVEVTATLDRPGFYPAGGGRFAATVGRADRLEPIEILDRGAELGHRAIGIVSNLHHSIAEREMAAAADILGWNADCLHLRQETRSPGPGNVVMLIAEHENVTELFTGFGQKGVSAESVGKRVANACKDYLSGSFAVGPHLADQLLVPMALAGGGRFTTSPPTQHTLTNIEVIGRFLDIPIRLDEAGDGCVEVTIGVR